MLLPICYNNTVIFLLILPLALEDYEEFFGKGLQNTFETYSALGLMLINSAGTILSVIWCMAENPPTTMNTVRTLNKVVVTFLSIFLFKEHPTLYGLMRMLLSVFGGVLHKQEVCTFDSEIRALALCTATHICVWS